MFWLRNKKIKFQLHTLIGGPVLGRYSIQVLVLIFSVMSLVSQGRRNRGGGGGGGARGPCPPQ